MKASRPPDRPKQPPPVHTINKTTRRFFFNPLLSTTITLLVIVVAVWCIIKALLLFGALPKLPQDDGGWLQDAYVSDLASPQRCDIDRVDANHLSVSDFYRVYRNKKPVIIKNALSPASAWGALTKWTKDELFAHYGNRSLKAGMGSDIVSSGGGQGLPSTTLADILEPDEADGEVFSFDTEFSRTFPELMRDFTTPAYFRSFTKGSWNMLSIGGPRRGLPFHVHGETWIAIIFGRKKWFVYPPHRGLHNLSAIGHSPLIDVWSWFTTVYPRLSSLPESERPLEFTQQRGEVVYLPPGWKHLTLNLGETIGVGGQAPYNSKDRLRDGKKVLEKEPWDYEALYGVGLSYAHMAIDTTVPPRLRQQYLNQALAYLSRAVSARPCQPDPYLIAGEVIREANINNSYQLAGAWIQRLQDLYNTTTTTIATTDTNTVPCQGQDKSSDSSITATTITTSTSSCRVSGAAADRSIFARVHHKIARFYLQARLYPQAQQALQRVLTLRPHSPTAYIDLAYAYLYQGPTCSHRAREALQSATRLASSDPQLVKQIEKLHRMLTHKGLSPDQ